MHINFDVTLNYVKSKSNPIDCNPLIKAIIECYACESFFKLYHSRLPRVTLVQKLTHPIR